MARDKKPMPEPAPVHAKTYECLMGLSCTGHGGYRYCMPGELVELSEEHAEPLLKGGAVKLVE